MRFGRKGFREVERNFGTVERSYAPLYPESDRPGEELPHIKSIDPKTKEGRAYMEAMLANLPDEICSNPEIDKLPDEIKPESEVASLPDVITSESEVASLPDFFTNLK